MASVTAWPSTTGSRYQGYPGRWRASSVSATSPFFASMPMAFATRIRFGNFSGSMLSVSSTILPPPSRYAHSMSASPELMSDFGPITASAPASSGTACMVKRDALSVSILSLSSIVDARFGAAASPCPAVKYTLGMFALVT